MKVSIINNDKSGEIKKRVTLSLDFNSIVVTHKGILTELFSKLFFFLNQALYLTTTVFTHSSMT